MSELMVVAYSDRNRATEVIDVVCRLDNAWLDCNDVIIAERDKKGRLRMPDQPLPQGGPLAWRALWRHLLEPRASSGGPAGGSREHVSGTAGIPEAVLQAARDLVARGDSALILLIRTGLPPPVEDILCSSSDSVLRAPLSTAQDALLSSVLDVVGPVEGERV
jgi:uncharacterized membrane protein